MEKWKCPKCENEEYEKDQKVCNIENISIIT